MKMIEMIKNINHATDLAEAEAETAPETGHDYDWYMGEGYYQYGEASLPINIFSKKEYTKLYTLLENLFHGGVLYDRETGKIIDFADTYRPVTGVFLLHIRCRIRTHRCRYDPIPIKWKKSNDYYWHLEPVT